ncbi:hypothetical protein F5Y12DRAFT_712520 [Xylaria sp. FL1777]|nr:hypothetical protein F5Y12DRAFT_712520 [Xylaria sp. FL1777]
MDVDEDDIIPLKTKLLEIIDYTDLTLECDGKQFKVHRAYVCAQSPVIAAALKGSFMEAKTGLLNVSFDIQSVRRFIEFIYTGDYHMSPDPAIELLLSTVLDETSTPETQPKDTETDEEGVDDPAAGLGSEADVPEPLEGISDRLICHSRMNSIADYYNVPALAALSRSKTEAILASEWSAEPFCDLVQQSIGYTNDKRFLRILGTAAADHILELHGKPIFYEGGIAEWLASYIIPTIVSKLVDAEVREAQLVSRLSSAEWVAKRESLESVRLLKNVNECVQLLKKHRACRNPLCNAEFTCYFDYNSQRDPPTYILHCSRCHAGHDLREVC